MIKRAKQGSSTLLSADELVEEIRLNPNYANYLFSEYKGKHDKESVPVIKKKTLLLNDFISKLNESRKVFTGTVMPPNCRYIEPLNRGYLAVIEEPPAFRTIFLDKSLNREFQELQDAGKLDEYDIPKDFLSKRKNPYQVNLAVPYTIFLLWITEYFGIGMTEVYFRTSQLKGLSDNLLRAPFLNIPDEQRVCYQTSKYPSLGSATQGAIKAFWESVFNQDYTYNYNSYRKVPIIGNYLEWEALSRINPMFIYSAEWLPMGYNLGARVNHMIEDAGGRAHGSVGYQQLADLFYSRRDSGVEVKPSPRSSRRYKLYFDISNGVYLDSAIQIETGDTFKTHDGKTAFIDSFAGFSDGSDIKYIQVDIDSHKHLMKFNRACKKFLLDKIKEERFAVDFELSSGDKIKSGDIVIVKTSGGTELYRKVDYIRKSRGIYSDEDIEIKVGSNFYLGSKFDAKKFDSSSPEYKGIKLEKDKEYIMIGGRQHGVFLNGHKVKYTGLDVAGNDLIAKFENILPGMEGASDYINFSRANDYQGAYPIEDVRQFTSGIVKIGRRIYTITRNGRTTNKDGLWQVGPYLVYESGYSLNYFPVSHIMKNLIDGDHFHIDGVDFDVDFTIGDKVVVADWTNPLSVLSVKTIRGFKQEGDTFDLVLADKNEKLSTVRYIESNQTINVGKVRKVTNKHGKLSVGTKIIANETGITNFPKKDVNIIVAFINDMPGEPLVLCSNGCTLWYSDIIKNFKTVSMKSKAWKDLQHVPLDLSKIKFQAGDIVNGLSDFTEPGGFLLFDPAPTRSLKAISMESMANARPGYEYTVDKYFLNDMIFDCIPAPRVATTKIEESDIVTGYLNIYTYQVELNSDSMFTFLKPKE